MTAPIDSLFFEIDAFVEKLEDAGFDMAEIVDALSEYVDVATEYL